MINVPDYFTFAQYDFPDDSSATLEKITDPISVFADLTGINVPHDFSEGTAIVADFYEIYELLYAESRKSVQSEREDGPSKQLHGGGRGSGQLQSVGEDDESDSIAINMLLNFEKYHAVMDLYCTQRSCSDNVDLMGDAFETINRMKEKDIDLAINVYNIANRHQIVLVEAEKIINELVEEIANETGISKSVV